MVAVIFEMFYVQISFVVVAVTLVAVVAVLVNRYRWYGTLEMIDFSLPDIEGILCVICVYSINKRG